MSVVPPPISTRQTPSSFSSSASTAWLDASCSSTTSSTARPQRCTHFTMFCAALSAPVTMWTFASSRTPDMPIGSRIPSWLSIRNSCGRMWRIFWSAGIATARAASITRSTSSDVTSLLRIATMPWELRLRTWLPAMPAYTEWISHPAMSSASSTARWIDCTVDSMLTTTPRFRPREGCEPSPMTSTLRSCVSSPTIATTFDVPMSRPTIRLRSFFLGIWRNVLGVVRDARGFVPTDRKTVAVAEIDIVHRAGPRRGDERACHLEEALEARVHILPSEAHLDAVAEREAPRTARIELDTGQAHADGGEARERLEIKRRDFFFRPVGPDQLRQFRRHVAR